VPSFFDTNILLYAVDEGEPEKLGIASTLVEEHLVEGDGMISVQVLREFYSASRKLSRPLSDEQAQEMVRYFSNVQDTRRRRRDGARGDTPRTRVHALLLGGPDRGGRAVGGRQPPPERRPPARAGDPWSAGRESLSHLTQELREGQVVAIMNRDLLEPYTDYLLSALSYTTVSLLGSGSTSKLFRLPARSYGACRCTRVLNFD
jgi:hypothetical protein